MLDIVRDHSFGCKALKTKIKITISAVQGSIPSGSPSDDVISHTEACIVPAGGDLYRGLCYRMYITQSTRIDESQMLQRTLNWGVRLSVYILGLI